MYMYIMIILIYIPQQKMTIIPFFLVILGISDVSGLLSLSWWFSYFLCGSLASNYDSNTK